MDSESRYNDTEKLNFGVIIALFRTMKMIRQSENKTLDRAQLTTSQFSVLETLYHKGPLRVCELLEKTLSTGGNMTVVLKNLENDGLIMKNRDQEDRRAFNVQLTRKGYELIDRVFPEHIREVEDFVSPLEEGEKRELVRLLKKLNRF